MKNQERIITYTRRKIFIYSVLVMMILLVLCGRVIYIMAFQGDKYSEMALNIQQRRRSIKAMRGNIYDVNGNIIASNKTVCTISVIYSQVKNPEKVINVLSRELNMDEKEIRKKVEKISLREKIKSNVDKAVGDRIRQYELEGVKIDEDYRRYYPYSTLASKVLGFTGADNQGIIGLEVEYDSYLKGIDGSILTKTDAAGIEIDNVAESRQEPIPGYNLQTTIDVNIQMYAQQIAYKALESKQAEYASVVVMNPQNGEIMAMVNAPEYDLNNPFTIIEEMKDEKQNQDTLNKMWRNQCINDTYEPGSTFKVITAAAALEEQVISLDTHFFCPGYKIVDDRRIRCHKVQGHGSESFVEAAMHSCNPAFIEIGLRLGVDNFYKYLDQFGILSKTGIDLPGEASTIIHQKDNVGNVELATMSFGQSFQITPIRFLTTVSALINGGNMVTPHLAKNVTDVTGNEIKSFDYPIKEGIISKDTSTKLDGVLEQVVSEGTGNKAYIEGFSIGGKTATSQKLPRSSRKYIASFMAFAPADNPKVLAMIIIDEPKGTYYGGTVVGPLMKELFENILPYLNACS